ncbi:spore germination protein [Alicyclobacillus fodiniaquatilis]|uniref:Spore germination protein n=1 Tax=Alicyclobacillus fodiniaquatilis TaxID=1661150 RepID=A0ABW4JK40_9BACL
MQSGKRVRLRRRTKLLESVSYSVEVDEFQTDVLKNEAAFRAELAHCSDICFRSLHTDCGTAIVLIYVDGLIDIKLLDQVVLQPLATDVNAHSSVKLSKASIQRQLATVSQVHAVSTVSGALKELFRSKVVVLIDGENQALIADLQGFEKRAVEEPSAELTVRGPRDGFTETLRVNTSLIRRRIRTPRLKMESFTLGELSDTDIVISYIDGIAPSAILDEVRTRIRRIKIDGILESSYIEEMIEDSPFTPFPLIQNTERPDAVCSSLLEGKIAIFVDTTPFVLIVPMTFWSGLQASEDYYERFIYASFIRILRLLLVNVALFLPSLYVAVTTFHPQLIPTNLLISIAAAREGVPFPAVIEALIMETMFEGLREAGVRLPKPIGSAVSIVGALVIGQAAVQAGIISAPMVIVVAATGIASFAIPRYNLGTAYRILRFPLLILAGVLGLYGICFGALLILIHLVNLRSFGVPYMTPVSPQLFGEWRDVFIRSPRWNMTRSPMFSSRMRRRMPAGQQPSPEQENRRH